MINKDSKGNYIGLEKLILIKKYRGMSIYLDPEANCDREQFAAINQKSEEIYYGTSLFEVERTLNEHRYEEIDIDAIITDTMDYELRKVHFKRKNLFTNVAFGRVIEGTEDDYDNGKEMMKI